jgi:hypothetical protein
MKTTHTDAIDILKAAAIQTPLSSPEWNSLVNAGIYVLRTRDAVAFKAEARNRNMLAMAIALAAKSKQDAVDILRAAVIQTAEFSPAWTALVHAAQHLNAAAGDAIVVATIKRDAARAKRNAARKARHDALTSLGLVRVRVNGKVFYE